MNNLEDLQHHVAHNLNDLKRLGIKQFASRRFEILSNQYADAHGQQHQYDLVVHPGAAVILPLLNDSQLIMIRNRRFAGREELWELPAGTLEKDEEPIVTAKRELLEETGYDCVQILPLTAFYTSPGYCNEAMYAFVAKDLSYHGQNLDENEEISVETVSWNQALDMIQKGKIRDGKTVTTLLYYHTFNSGIR